MANDAYTKTLKKIMTDNSPAPSTARTRAEIETEISEISSALTKPMHNILRLDLVEARRHLRKQLEVL